MRKYLLYSFVSHALIFSALFVNFKLKTQDKHQEDVWVEVFGGGKHGVSPGKGDFSNLLGKKSAYEISKDGAGQRRLSDKEEIEKESEDDAKRPSYKKKTVIFSQYLDAMGDGATPIWFRELEKVAAIKKVIKDRTFETKLIVIIDKYGKVVRTVVSSSSGDTLFDVAAKTSFEAQVFPNPPKDLIDSDGLGRITWTFEVYVNIDMLHNKHSKLRLYRKDSE